MTVKELIEKLNKSNQTNEVTILDEDDNEKDIIRVEVYKHSVFIVIDQNEKS